MCCKMDAIMGRAGPVAGNTEIRQPTREEMVEALTNILRKPVLDYLSVLFSASRKAPSGGWETPFDQMAREAVEKILRERLPLTAPPDDLLP